MSSSSSSSKATGPKSKAKQLSPKEQEEANTQLGQLLRTFDQAIARNQAKLRQMDLAMQDLQVQINGTLTQIKWLAEQLNSSSVDAKEEVKDVPKPESD